MISGTKTHQHQKPLQQNGWTWSHQWEMEMVETERIRSHHWILKLHGENVIRLAISQILTMESRFIALQQYVYICDFFILLTYTHIHHLHMFMQNNISRVYFSLTNTTWWNRHNFVVFFFRRSWNFRFVLVNPLDGNLWLCLGKRFPMFCGEMLEVVVGGWKPMKISPGVMWCCCFLVGEGVPWGFEYEICRTSLGDGRLQRLGCVYRI